MADGGFEGERRFSNRVSGQDEQESGLELILLYIASTMSRAAGSAGARSVDSSRNR
jgi:hypothetical protein